jgi:hypothetical protein
MGVRGTATGRKNVRSEPTSFEFIDIRSSRHPKAIACELLAILVSSVERDAHQDHEY